jgi:hypothetical protein
MRKLLLCLFLFSGQVFGNEILWEVTKGISSPESTYYEPTTKNIFVSNIVGAGDKKDGKGHISLLDINGKVLQEQWVMGLNAPKGMRSYKGVLWVTDIDEIVIINIKTAKVIEKIKIKGAKFLNDIAITSSGVVYVSDSLTTTIHKITNYKPNIFVTGSTYSSPNGLLIKGEHLIVASWGLTTDWSTIVSGSVYKIHLESKLVTPITKPGLGNLDGIEMIGKNEFITSDWVSGKVYKVHTNGKSELIYTGVQGYADIGFIPVKQILLIPQMKDNKITAIKI